MHNANRSRHALLVNARRWVLAMGLFLALSACMDVAGAGGAGSDTWREEVLLHDGQKIMVDRAQSYGGAHEIGQRPPVRDMTITFALPGSGKRISWTSEYGEDVGRSNFTLAALHILNDTPYVVALPNLCQSYNKWGRPNPSYVIFKYQASTWTRIPLAELPTEFKSTNLVVESLGHSEALARQGKVSAEMVQQLNGQMTQPEYRGILREPGGVDPSSCEKTFPNGKGRALGAGWFSSGRDKAECLRTCQRYEYDAAMCPCNKFFKGE